MFLRFPTLFLFKMNRMKRKRDGGKGNGEGAAPKKRRYEWQPWGEARKYARGLGLSGRRAWQRHKQRPADIPSKPDDVYQRWAGWGDFLGTGNVAKGKGKSRMLPFAAARAFARRLHLSGARRAWHHWCRTHAGERPRDVPTTPERTYTGKGWVSWPDFLGNQPEVARGSSRFCGVRWSKHGKKWLARIKHGGQQRHIGYFDDEEEAAIFGRRRRGGSWIKKAAAKAKKVAAAALAKAKAMLNAHAAAKANAAAAEEAAAAAKAEAEAKAAAEAAEKAKKKAEALEAADLAEKAEKVASDAKNLAARPCISISVLTRLINNLPILSKVSVSCVFQNAT